MPLLDLPNDVLEIVLSRLEPRDYLAFCRVSKAVYREFRQDSLYWRPETAATFRLPISPLLAADGPRWYWLYKRLRTQTRLFTWGQGLRGNFTLGRPWPSPRRPLPHLPPRHPRTFQRTTSSWPNETPVPDDVGVIVDLQCGGWSTTILSSDGQLYTVGALDSLNGITIGETAVRFTELKYLTHSTSAIRHFSAGRRHVLALTDDGEILSWDRVNGNGLKVFSRTGRDFGGKPIRVAAGWSESSAYVPQTGIVYWTPLKNDQADEMLDGIHVQEMIIPNTARRQTDQGRLLEIVKHVVLEGFIIWITSDSKLCACPVGERMPFEVPGFASEGRELKDVQGQFHTFGVFTGAGEVLAGNVDYLRRCSEAFRADPSVFGSGDWSTLTRLLSSRPRDVPALQHTGVVALSYGDYHYHALHADGKITSYGTDSQCCGSLGLLGPDSGARFRGVRKERPGVGGDAKLLPIAELRGRQVWFEPEKKDWLGWLEDSVRQPSFTFEGQPAHLAWDDHPDRQAAFSEWVEQEGRNWDRGPATASADDANGAKTDHDPSPKMGDYDQLGAYFAITIAAAGWRSGALVLVDEDKAHEARSKWVTVKEKIPRSVPGQFESVYEKEEYVWKAQGFPKVILPDGFEMPGEGEPRIWRDGRPTMDELGLAAQTSHT